MVFIRKHFFTAESQRTQRNIQRKQSNIKRSLRLCGAIIFCG